MAYTKVKVKRDKHADWRVTVHTGDGTMLERVHPVRASAISDAVHIRGMLRRGERAEGTCGRLGGYTVKFQGGENFYEYRISV